MDDSLENINESSKPIPNAELFVYGTRKINVVQELNRYNRKKKGWDATYRSTINGITKLDRDLGRIYADAQVKFLKKHYRRYSPVPNYNFTSSEVTGCELPMTDSSGMAFCAGFEMQQCSPFVSGSLCAEINVRNSTDVCRKRQIMCLKK